MRFIKPINLTKDSIILDVRTKKEHQKEEIALPHICQELETLNPPEFIRENHIAPEQTINILCSSGGRASQAAQMFENAGYDNVAVIIGGIVEAEYEGLNIVRH